MEIGIVGLGKMGANMARRLNRDGHRVVGYDRAEKAVDELAQEGTIVPAFSMEEILAKLEASPRVLWSMVPAGPPTEAVVTGLAAYGAALFLQPVLPVAGFGFKLALVVAGGLAGIAGYMAMALWLDLKEAKSLPRLLFKRRA